MDKSKAIELLKQCLNEVPKLRKLHHDNQDFVLWFDNARNIIKAALTPDDLKRFSFAQPIFSNDFRGGSVYKSIYLAKLTGHETALKSILQKYGLPSIKEKPAEKTQQKDTVKSPIQLFDAMQFHPRVIKVSESLFKTDNYSSAIFEAFKAVHNYVQDKTGLTLDGVNLMEKVFNENKPILQLNELLTKSDRDEQKGFKYLFMGSQMGIRNPPAHENVKPEEQNIALEYLGIASLLMRRIDGSKLVKLNIKETSS